MTSDVHRSFWESHKEKKCHGIRTRRSQNDSEKWNGYLLLHNDFAYRALRFVCSFTFVPWIFTLFEKSLGNCFRLFIYVMSVFCVCHDLYICSFCLWTRFEYSEKLKRCRLLMIKCTVLHVNMAKTAVETERFISLLLKKIDCTMLVIQFFFCLLFGEHFIGLPFVCFSLI